jgi:hypothetical protein
MATLPPPPVGSEPNSFVWIEWYRALRNFLVAEGGTIPWNSVSKTGSNLNEIATREHNVLQSFQGGTTGERYHLTQAQHTDLTDGGDATIHTHRAETESWDDLRFPANGINPIGPTANPTVDSTSGLLLFSGTVDNAIVGIAQMPHAWKEGSTLRPHIHVRFPTASTNVSRWRFGYDIANVNADFSNALGTYTTLSTISITNPNNTLRNAVGSFVDLTMSGKTASCIILWRVDRLANSDAADTETNAVALIEFDIHYQLNRNGTSTELI